MGPISELRSGDGGRADLSDDRLGAIRLALTFGCATLTEDHERTRMKLIRARHTEGFGYIHGLSKRHWTNLMTIKTPKFDEPIGLGATSEKRPVDPYSVTIEVGTRVMLTYKGRNLRAEVVEVEEDDTVFVGRVSGFEGEDASYEGLNANDLIRFRKENIRWID